jgi:hypothetical protein
VLGGKVGQVGKEQAHAGLGECAAGQQGAEQVVEDVALCWRQGALEVLHERCAWVFFSRVVSFGCCHSG